MQPSLTLVSCRLFPQSCRGLRQSLEASCGPSTTSALVPKLLRSGLRLLQVRPALLSALGYALGSALSHASRFHSLPFPARCSAAQKQHSGGPMPETVTTCFRSLFLNCVRPFCCWLYLSLLLSIPPLAAPSDYPQPALRWWAWGSPRASPSRRMRHTHRGAHRCWRTQPHGGAQQGAHRAHRGQQGELTGSTSAVLGRQLRLEAEKKSWREILHFCLPTTTMAELYVCTYRLRMSDSCFSTLAALSGAFACVQNC